MDKEEHLVIPRGSKIFVEEGVDPAVKSFIENLSDNIQIGGAVGETPEERKQREENYSLEFFRQIRKSVENSIPEEQLEHFRILGEKFHQSFDVTKGNTSFTGSKEVMLEECLSYIQENLKAGLDPNYLETSEKQLLEAMHGSEWYKVFHYQFDEKEKKYVPCEEVRFAER